ncbi:bifunctional phosphopantothenoylcysteine decarboxylase/phosphopantothenate--cysteine ligase CoaBC [Amorphus orientalis]|uniref:Coenzyme A biosynthesis bifunctional protein CoaBC n=1 Tax=Amorphus orientalis TaxID=649198 RepID=A0AAE3VQ55_9HYPH|nr:bifunctional phosphopantothenoylcysteine decarboxylase/phosphopantothenate--cysteine ligase CoaBC [Amorphus orientalis]MDQ0316178.1 phosphopantothenoylcysteine decarboxylase/phosphopantothenate--cysteine ligase [Amorphus orientalis]
MLAGKRVLLVISGGIAAYKVLELIRRLRERGASVPTILSGAADQFVTPLTVGALSGEPVHRDLFDLTRESDIGHIRLSRDADLLVVAPATADLIAKMANGHADDLASTALMATDKPVLIAPAMNPRMWSNPATRRNMDLLRADGIRVVGPNVGEMAERGEAGEGRMAEPARILAAIEAAFAAEPALISGPKVLAGRRVIVTSGPTHEPIDPVRYLANRSSGRQGHAIATACAAAGADVTLVSGPVTVPDPAGVRTIAVETASQMLEAVEASLPADVAVMAAAVADWRVASASERKLKKPADGAPPVLELVENPDILATIGRHHTLRPRLVVGFAAETDDLLENALSKLARKGADFIVANDVSPATGVMGGEANTVRIVTPDGNEEWPKMSKIEVADRLVARIAASLDKPESGS